MKCLPVFCFGLIAVVDGARIKNPVKEQPNILDSVTLGVPEVANEWFETEPGEKVDVAGSSIAVQISLPSGEKDQGTCKPKCTWQCSQPVCDQVCEPDCEAPRCRMRCPRPDVEGCAVTCDEPTCWTECPPGNNTCAGENCPECTNKCKEKDCKMHCDKSLDCVHECEHPKCTWRCRAPEACPKPECKMVCQAATHPCPSCTFHEELPEHLADGSFVLWDKLYPSTTTRPTHVDGETGFDWSVDWNNETVAVLGDVSGSMGSHNRLKNLQDNFNRLIAKAAEAKQHLVLGAWNTGITFSDSTDKAQQTAWVSALKANGGNDMRQAIQKTVDKYPKVKTIHVLGDGDTSPFTNAAADWTEFRSKFPGVVFNFIAFGKDAKAEMMKKMAEVGSGTFLAVADLS